MIRGKNSFFVAALGAVFLFSAASAFASSEGTPQSLADLLEQARQASASEEMENRRREQEFNAAKDKQAELLAAATAAENTEQERAAALELKFEENEKVLPELEETLRTRLGTLGELFGVVRQVAGDAKSRTDSSLISAQLPGRGDFLTELAGSNELPSIDELDKLWLLLLEEMTEQGRVVKFPATVITADGKEGQREVIRVGAFNAVSGGKYLQFLPENGKLAELGRQPASRHLDTVAAFEASGDDYSGIAIDPSRGTLLSMLIQAPNLEERVQQGGTVGYVIIALGIVGLFLALYRILSLAFVGQRIRAQLGNSKPNHGNALGRVLSVYEENSDTDIETLELRLDEAILKETSTLQRGATFVKVLSVIAPLLGLLGTVTGMILTFQQITLFGTGDPKLMAGGISQALVTTVLGLVMAIPLTLLHSMIADRSRTLIQILEEQSIGLIARKAEQLAGRGPRVAEEAA